MQIRWLRSRCSLSLFSPFAALSRFCIFIFQLSRVPIFFCWGLAPKPRWITVFRTASIQEIILNCWFTLLVVQLALKFGWFGTIFVVWRFCSHFTVAKGFFLLIELGFWLVDAPASKFNGESTICYTATLIQTVTFWVVHSVSLFRMPFPSNLKFAYLFSFNFALPARIPCIVFKFYLIFSWWPPSRTLFPWSSVHLWFSSTLILIAFFCHRLLLSLSIPKVFT